VILDCLDYKDWLVITPCLDYREREVNVVWTDEMGTRDSLER
jgi:hypothetical protein